MISKSPVKQELLPMKHSYHHGEFVNAVLPLIKPNKPLINLLYI